MSTNDAKIQPFLATVESDRSRASRRRRTARAALVTGAAIAAMLASACSAKQPSPVEPADSGPESDVPMAKGLNAMVVVSQCPDAKRIKVRTAQAAIERLVGPCASVPGGKAHFSATLQPGGAIVLASPEGDPAEGVVPTCVLQNKLTHRVPLKSACTLDVQLDERTVPVDASTGAAPQAAPPK